MRLRTRLALAFALLALVPLAVVVPPTLTRLRDTLSRELDARMEAATASAQESLERSSATARRAVEELVDSTSMEDLAREARDRPTRAIQAGTAEALMKSRGLSVLALFDREGRVLSSGHLPARRETRTRPSSPLRSRSHPGPCQCAWRCARPPDSVSFRRSSPRARWTSGTCGCGPWAACCSMRAWRSTWPASPRRR